MDVSPKSHPRNQGVEERGVASVVFVSFPIAQQMVCAESSAGEFTALSCFF